MGNARPWSRQPTPLADSTHLAIENNGCREHAARAKGRGVLNILRRAPFGLTLGNVLMKGSALPGEPREPLAPMARRALADAASPTEKFDKAEPWIAEVRAGSCDSRPRRMHQARD